MKGEWVFLDWAFQTTLGKPYKGMEWVVVGFL